MIVKKPLKKSQYLRTFEALDKRMDLDEEDKYHLLNMQKGHVGEVSLSSSVERNLTANALVLNDLVFTEKGSTFQVDTSILTGNKFYMIEVKNYEGDFQFKLQHLLSFSGQEIVNPLTKLDEKATKMRKLMKKWNANLTLEPLLVFVNPAFTMYNAPIGSSIIYPTQIQAMFARMNQHTQPLSKKHYYIADKMLKEHQDESAFRRKFPDYTYDFLEKGLWCLQCSSSSLSITQRTCTCNSCGHKSSLDEVVIFHVEEIKLLFPHLKITPALIYDWLGSAISMRRIQKILLKYYKKCGATYGSYYE